MKRTTHWLIQVDTPAPIEKFYIDGDLKIVTEKPDKALTVNVSSYTIRDIRNGILQSYPIVKIGTQYWMREDLQTAYYNDSKNIPIQKILGTGDRCFQYSVPGFLLYNGEAVLTGKLAPLDWRIPSDNDWNRLKEYIAGNASALKKQEHGVRIPTRRQMRQDSALPPKDCCWKEIMQQL